MDDQVNKNNESESIKGQTLQLSSSPWSLEFADLMKQDLPAESRPGAAMQFGHSFIHGFIQEPINCAAAGTDYVFGTNVLPHVQLINAPKPAGAFGTRSDMQFVASTLGTLSFMGALGFGAYKLGGKNLLGKAVVGEEVETLAMLEAKVNKLGLPTIPQDKLRPFAESVLSETQAWSNTAESAALLSKQRSQFASLRLQDRGLQKEARLLRDEIDAHSAIDDMVSHKDFLDTKKMRGILQDRPELADRYSDLMSSRRKLDRRIQNFLQNDLSDKTDSLQRSLDVLTESTGQAPLSVRIDWPRPDQVAAYHGGRGEIGMSVKQVLDAKPRQVGGLLGHEGEHGFQDWHVIGRDVMQLEDRGLAGDRLVGQLASEYKAAYNPGRIDRDWLHEVALDPRRVDLTDAQLKGAKVVSESWARPDGDPLLLARNLELKKCLRVLNSDVAENPIQKLARHFNQEGVPERLFGSADKIPKGWRPATPGAPVDEALSKLSKETLIGDLTTAKNEVKKQLRYEYRNEHTEIGARTTEQRIEQMIDKLL